MLAIIGGTGVELGAHPALQNVRDEIVQTRWGKALVTRAELADSALTDDDSPASTSTALGSVKREVLFLHRHADPESGRRHVPPHKNNYRANIAALKKLGATAIFASTAVGCLREEWPSGTLVLLDQFLDFTSNRDKTFFDERAVHLDFTEPYCPHARETLRGAAQRLGFELKDGGTYICTDGPRFETPAEIRAFKAWGADVVGMTGVPEVVLAREAEISYAGVSIVTNAAAGISAHPLTQSEVTDAMKVALPRVVELFLETARYYRDDPSIPARNATVEYRSGEFEPIEFIVG